MLSDEQIAAMTPVQRQALILRLRSPIRDVVAAPEKLLRLRRLRQGLTLGGAVLLVPWTVYLAMTLPGTVVVDSWQTVWVGYDILLVAMLAVTAWLGWKHRLAVVLTAFGTGILVLADAWFDVFTAATPVDAWTSIAAALLVELPVGLLLIGAAARLLRLSLVTLLVLPSDTSIWKVPIVLLDDGALQAHHPSTP